ncbi:hypothetical protein [Candidatus Nanohalococcus occultus]|uniref:Uncharacterized protein n=1 Tax=Candidatus Nanohalococcus occultus TaxID=2978047 RepID=A0ABY8CHW0_9ARCH|nr:hypothetical protein SVXNc_0241 [Candidatus Nanohaloarchaeota archaeon SVXNc]
MYPDKYVKDLESSQRRSRYGTRVIEAALFISGILLLGPFIHELGHISWMEFQSCMYRFSPGFSALIGFYGKVEPLCYLSRQNLAFFYASGYLSTFLAGFGLREFGLRVGENTSFLEYLAGGMLVSILVSVTYKGDVANMLGALNLSALELPFLGLLVLGTLGTSYKFLEEAQNGRKES